MFIRPQTSIIFKYQLIQINVSGVEIIVVVHQTHFAVIADVVVRKQKNWILLLQSLLDFKSLCNWVFS